MENQFTQEQAIRQIPDPLRDEFKIPPSFYGNQYRACVISGISLSDRYCRSPTTPVLPVQKVIKYKRDIRVVKSSPFTLENLDMRNKRGKITTCTHSAMLRLSEYIRNCEIEFKALLTFTYGENYPNDGKIVKKHLNQLGVELRSLYSRQCFVWWLEFQKRGAPHLHMLTDLEGKETVIRKRNRHDVKYESECFVDLENQLLPRWNRIIEGGENNLKMGLTCERLRETDGALRYASAHAAKSNQKEVPENYFNVGRFWGKIGARANNKSTLKTTEMSTNNIALCEAFGWEVFNNRTATINKFIYDYKDKIKAQE